LTIGFGSGALRFHGEGRFRSPGADIIRPRTQSGGTAFSIAKPRMLC